MSQGSEDIPPSNLTAEHLLDGLLTAEFSYRSCRSRYEFDGYHKKSSHKPSPYLIAKLRKQEALQKRCGPGTAAHKKALQRLESGEGAAADVEEDNCRYLVNISFRGLGNRMLAIASAFLYAVLTERVLLVDGGKDVADLFCEPFSGATWLLPPAGQRSPLRHLDDYGMESKESLGNMLQSGAVVASADGNVSWSSPRPPPYVYLHLAGGYGYHDKLFYCGTHQRLLRGVPWLLMRTDSYLVPGLFLTSSFLGDLETMFPEKDATFYHLGRYLFHPTNAVWHAVTSYYRSNLAGADRRVGIQIRVFQEKQPPQQILDQLLSCVRDEKLLPEIAATNDTSSRAVLVTSLNSWYSDRIRGEYGDRVTGGVHQPSHEGRQRSGDPAHDMRALSEMYLLSMCDVLVTSGLSTFGYVAQGLGGLHPWVMARAPSWDKWTEDQAAPDPPCQRALSVEPCFHSPSYYDCAARRDVDLDKLVPYIRRCVDVSWGIKLVNESSSQW
ncbi:galactoside 2-alpha-L-fucosyltransferase-like isoform X2 [Phragmites australis]|uniref:galactoside 2-alpha-L-fucosyltransferase-like isoform X2 n=1 Tax=Phragmites australis TaxID=29695 RepID=UPI002D7811D1|nr:galactoside 2-alpha-L-fucosyltransferase-like isoform X2 [Phragmites australis]